LYQGGVVPGNELRVVQIADTDTEACCGTHCDNTAEVGYIKIIKASRISDGIVRLYYVAGERSLSVIGQEAGILNTLTEEWGIAVHEILPTASRFFDGYKRYAAQLNKQSIQILELQMKVHLLDQSIKAQVAKSIESNPTLYISNMPSYAQKLSETKKGSVYVGDSFVYALLGDPSLLDVKKFQAFLESDAKRIEEDEAKSKEAAEKKEIVSKGSKLKFVVKASVNTKPKSKKDKPVKVDGITELVVFGLPSYDKAISYLSEHGFTLLQDTDA